MNYSLEQLRNEYETLFEGCVVRSGKLSAVSSLAKKIIANRKRYETVGLPVDIPWFVIGCIHSMESSLDFTKHLYNGDPLTGRTVNVPKGQPPTGNPPFTWEESASGALAYQGWTHWHDWSVAGCLFKFESYNGFGYRRSTIDIPSPYLWSYSNYYTKGKYVKDGIYDPDAISSQCGAAVLLKELSDMGAISLSARPPQTKEALLATISQLGKVVRFSNTVYSNQAYQLQVALAQYLEQPLSADGYAGQNTSDAYEQVTGCYLQGDPRGTLSH